MFKLGHCKIKLGISVRCSGHKHAARLQVWKMASHAHVQGSSLSEMNLEDVLSIMLFLHVQGRFCLTPVRVVRFVFWQ